MTNIRQMFSILLVFILFITMFSSVGVLAIEDLGGTKVDYINPNAFEYYTITIPAFLIPGQAGTITISGMWDSSRMIKVSTPKIVNMTDDNSRNIKTLDISFNGIQQVGNNTKTITIEESFSVEKYSNNWTGLIYCDIEMCTA
jgi:hypothetical protein